MKPIIRIICSLFLLGCVVSFTACKKGEAVETIKLTAISVGANGEDIPLDVYVNGKKLGSVNGINPVLRQQSIVPQTLDSLRISYNRHDDGALVRDTVIKQVKGDVYLDLQYMPSLNIVQFGSLQIDRPSNDSIAVSFLNDVNFESKKITVQIFISHDGGFTYDPSEKVFEQKDLAFGAYSNFVKLPVRDANGQLIDYAANFIDSETGYDGTRAYYLSIGLDMYGGLPLNGNGGIDAQCNPGKLTYIRFYVEPYTENGQTYQLQYPKKLLEL
ncbi:hypothetical protein LX64_04234 [Chitinophaga skermanii]|uniref:DUF4382 domain-containing protein n=1 Tax=Chitinophaga skermanii TaxID=331697 RepID=A0A327Q5H5_9BACT|nr:hypothetical protein [Chitinophaga skermanii]RAI99689.1 hypothetical protein LX64_04234 [Chitinophaga skermanii]